MIKPKPIPSVEMKNKKEVIFFEDAETYLIIGYKDIEKALKDLQKYEIKEMGLGKDEVCSDIKYLSPVQWREEDGYYYWNVEQLECEHCHRPYKTIRSGFIYRP
jgi:hypothetical protein